MFKLNLNSNPCQLFSGLDTLSYTTSATVNVLPPTNTRSFSEACFFAAAKASFTDGYAAPIRPNALACSSKSFSGKARGMAALQK